ncbi:MAG TPA: SPFH domain-containing protein [Candidatus Thermoplasmatota archaeon]|nr:SPFH domain-containing protein [Candidatus Thermoplasmatota archaeon]
MFLLCFVLALGAAGLFFLAVKGAGTPAGATGALLVVLLVLFVPGFFVLQPNESAVVTLFGSYRGTAREPGWYWTNPFTRRRVVSLRVHNFTTPQLKVNDADGNPIEIAAVIVWRVVDTARAAFDVEDYAQFVKIQAETVVRHLASRYPYDITAQPHGASLRGSSDEVLASLREELRTRLHLGGIEILDARLSHLAYSAEIAGAMLQRQQATAILAARQKIVEGAVGMVEDVLGRLDERGVLAGLQPADRARMVSSLLVVLTSDRGAQPVVKTV